MSARVFFVSYSFYPCESSGSQLLTDLVRSMSSGSACNLTVITSKLRMDGHNAKLDPRKKIEGVSIYRVPGSTFGKKNSFGRLLDTLSFMLSAMLLMAIKVKRGDVVIVKTDPPLFFAAIGFVLRFKSAKQINWIQDVFPEVVAAVGLNVPFKSFLIALRNSAMRKSCLNIVISEEMRAFFLKEGVYKEQLKVVSNWSETDQIKPLKRADNPYIDKYGLSGKFVVGYSGNIGLIHEMNTLLDAAKLMMGCIDVVFLIIGEGKNKDKLLRSAQDMGLNNMVFLPFQDRDLLKYTLNLPCAHLVTLKNGVSPYAYPSKIYGAMAAGKAILYIGEKDSEPFDFVMNSRIGISVSVGDPKLLVDSIYRLRNDKQLLLECSENSRYLATHSFDRDIQTSKWKKYIEHIERS